LGDHLTEKDFVYQNIWKKLMAGWGAFVAMIKVRGLEEGTFISKPRICALVTVRRTLESPPLLSFSFEKTIGSSLAGVGVGNQ